MTEATGSRNARYSGLPLLHLPEAHWPLADRERFARAFEQSHDIFSDEGSGSRLRPITRDSIKFGYRRWLGYLSTHHPALLADAPETRATPDTVRSFVTHLGLTCAPNTVASQVGKLHDALHHMYPDKDWSWLRRLKTRLERAIEKTARQPLFLTSASAINIALGKMDEIDVAFTSKADGTRSKAVKAMALDYRDTLLVALVVFFPLRRSNLEHLQIGSTLCRGAEQWSVDIPGELVKNGEPLAADLPIWLSERIDRFVQVYRPLIYRCANHAGLWASAKGRPAGGVALYEAFQKKARALFSKHLTLHDARRIAATTWAVHDPVNAAGAKDLLGDRSDRVFAEHYNLAGGIEASRQMASVVARKKR